MRRNPVDCSEISLPDQENFIDDAKEFTSRGGRSDEPVVIDKNSFNPSQKLHGLRLRANRRRALRTPIGSLDSPPIGIARTLQNGGAGIESEKRRHCIAKTASFRLCQCAYFAAYAFRLRKRTVVGVRYGAKLGERFGLRTIDNSVDAPEEGG
jgi:hypothetical protein